MCIKLVLVPALVLLASSPAAQAAPRATTPSGTGGAGIGVNGGAGVGASTVAASTPAHPIVPGATATHPIVPGATAKIIHGIAYAPSYAPIQVQRRDLGGQPDSLQALRLRRWSRRLERRRLRLLGIGVLRAARGRTAPGVDGLQRL